MARKAYISSDMAHDERLFDIAEEHPIAVLMFPWIISYLDDWGRGLASSKRIKSQLFPNVPIVTVNVIEEAIRAYAEVGLLELYEDESHKYMAIPMEKWFKWQTHIRGEKRHKDNSKYPPCPTDCAQMREDARECAQLIEKRTPTPTLSPSLSPSLSKEERDKGFAVQQLIKAWEETFGVLNGDPNRLMTLLDYMDKGMSLELIITAIHKSSDADSPMNYADGILRKQLRKGIKTVEQLTQDGGETNATRSGYRKEVHAVGTRTRSITGGKVGRV